MKCTSCSNCIENYSGNPYCFMGSFELSSEDLNADNVELMCIDFKLKESYE